MRLLVLNPNSTTRMTDSVVAEVRRLLALRGRHDVTVHGATCASGPEVISSPDSYSAGGHAIAADWPALDAVHRPDAVLLACFGDPGLAGLQALARRPVAGMATASLDAALAAGERFHIVTAGAAWDGMLRALVATHAAAPLLDGITILPADGLAASRDAAGTVRRLQQALQGLEPGGAPRCILGGAGFAGLRSQLGYAAVLTDGIEAATEELLAARPATQGQSI